MLSAPAGWVEMVEVNPPRLPDMTHMDLQGRWNHVLITDNPFKQVRVSPYAYAARITHDVDDVSPTVVCSTRDRNILAIESEVRGAIGNGVTSFLVVQGDMLRVGTEPTAEIVETCAPSRSRCPRSPSGRHEHPIAQLVYRRGRRGAHS